MKNQLFENNLQQVIDAFQLPGMIAILVERGEVSFNRGFGYANLEKKEPFTDETLCSMASVTKSFTAALTGCLVDQGVLEWTRPIREYIPDFKMMDEFATQAITLEDMLCHRSGLPYHENLLAHGVGRELADSGRAFRADLLLGRLPHFDPSSSFRSQFQYQDIVYTCVGAILEQITGQDYETLMAQYLLQPLGMEVSTFERAKARESGKLAQGYAIVDAQVQPIDFCDTRYIASSAGLYSNAQEMVRWLQLQLSGGRHRGKQIISEKSLEWIQQPHMLETGQGALTNGATTYGHGWRQLHLHGHVLVCHGGSFNGYRSFVGFIPEKEAGVIVLTNLNLTEGSTVAGMVGLDWLMDVEQAEERIADGLARSQWFRERDEQEQQHFEANRNLQNLPTNDLEAYRGHYVHPGYGTFKVELDEGALFQTYDERTFPLVPYDGNTFASQFQSTENHLLNMTFAFEADAQGNIAAVQVPLIPDIPMPRFVNRDG